MRRRLPDGMGRTTGADTVGALPGPDDVLRQTLPNGITVLARENWSAPSVVIEGYLTVGGIDEPAGLMGLASFTSGMLSRGTTQRTFAEINEAVEGVGAAIGFSADRWTTGFSTKSLAEDMGLVLGILADELRHPAFAREQMEKVRGLRMTALAERENNTRQMAAIAFREMAYPNHPLGRNLLGTRESNLQIDRDAIAQFYEALYRPQGMTVAVVGAIKAEDALAKVSEAFGDWTGARPPRPDLPPVQRPAAVAERHVVMPGKSQSDIFLGWPSMRRLDPDYEPARLANTVLGVFGLMGRLGEAVRERGGLAYYSYSQLSADRTPGLWTMVAGVNPANVKRAIDLIVEQVQRLRDEPIPLDELEDSKRYLTGSLPLQLETNDGVASILVDIEWYQLGLDYVQRYAGIINELTPEQLQAVVQKYMDPAAYVLAMAGP